MSLDQREHTARRRQGTAAGLFEPLVRAALGAAPPVRFEFWDGSGSGPGDGAGIVRVHSKDALRRALWAPGELGLARAYVAGEVDIDGDVFGVLRALRDTSLERPHVGFGVAHAALKAARGLGALRLPAPRPPLEEARPHGRLHSRRRDAEVVAHHYDVGDDFYRIVLGESMTYSCARFTHESATLEQAQAAKHELVSRKLGLGERPGLRLLDLGCGWGAMAVHAAVRHGAEVVGVTVSPAHAAAARSRVAAAGLCDRVEVRLQDYRDVAGEQFDAVSSIGMFEHVGAARAAQYFKAIRALLLPHGRLLNHAISTVGGSAMRRDSFIGRYVFPDGELQDVGQVVLAMEQAGFEVRDVESLREHYARTLRAWVANLDARWDEAVELVGTARARIWRLYIAASAIGFERGALAVHQVLGVVPDGAGGAGLPATRRAWD